MAGGVDEGWEGGCAEWGAGWWSMGWGGRRGDVGEGGPV